MLGITNKNRGDLTLNFILLSAKQFIYNCRLKQAPLMLENFKAWMKTTYKTEMSIAYKNCNWNKFNVRWSSYQTLFHD